MQQIEDLGPQYRLDNPFAARMQFHQSWYRATVLDVGFGCRPTGNCFGNLLQPEDGKRGLNFLSSDIAELAERSRALNPRGIEQNRLERNLLSSQPMCFNLFGPLAECDELAASLAQAFVTEQVSEVTAVAFEYSPQPRSEYLNDLTAFDVFIEYRRDVGRLEFLAIEVKLSEPFSPKRYPLADRREYQHWADLPTAPWLPAERESLDASAHNQLWRDHMLAFALKARDAERYASGKLILIRHPADAKTATAVAGYQRLLKDTDTTFVDMPLDRLMTHWAPMVAGTAHERWLSEFDRRYVNLAGSEELWRKFK